MNDPMTAVYDLVAQGDAKLARSEKVVNEVITELAKLNKRIGLDSITRTVTLDWRGYQNEIEAHVQYRLYPARAALPDEPGCGAYCEIRSVIFRGQDITGLLGREIVNALSEDICEGMSE